MKWKHGMKAELAKLANISPQYLSDILHRSKRCSPGTAVKIEKACEKLNIEINRYDLTFNRETRNELFYGDPV